MLKKLQTLEKPIRVGLTGAGCMGRGIAKQIAITPGLKLAWVADIDSSAAKSAAELGETDHHGTDTCRLIAEHPIDAFVESSNSIADAFTYCRSALEAGAHVILMNAEVDLAFGPELRRIAQANHKIVSSDAGDQHGVLATMIEEIELWGFKVKQAGNIKGYLRRDAIAAELEEEAAKRNLSPIQCCAYTDGTKLNIEMAVLANALGYLPTQVGMTGPRAKHVEEALESFDLREREYPSVDYLLGAEPGGGVYVIASCPHAEQIPYLSYYKIGDGPNYLFHRPYHLCHLETTRAIAKAVLYEESILTPPDKKITGVYAHAKFDLANGTEIPHGIGGDHFYGLIADCEHAAKNAWVPIETLDLAEAPIKLKRSIQKDAALTLRDLHQEYE